MSEAMDISFAEASHRWVADFERGVLFSKRYKRVVGFNKGGYTKVRFYRRARSAHRIIWTLAHGAPPDGYLDHINGDSLDNRLCNLRVATNSQNQANSRLSSRNKCGLKGVRWHPKDRNWQAKIKANGKSQTLGRFASAEEAHAAYWKAAQEIFGEFARAS